MVEEFGDGFGDCDLAEGEEGEDVVESVAGEEVDRWGLHLHHRPTDTNEGETERLFVVWCEFDWFRVDLGIGRERGG